MKLFSALPRLALLAMILLSSLAATHAQDGTADVFLSTFRDKYRVLLVFAPTAQDANYLEQMKLWENTKTGFHERQLLMVPVFPDGSKPVPDPPGALEKKFGVDPKAFAVVLIGKDGHDAYRSAKPVPAVTLYGTVDAMPMRRAEIKRQSTPTPAPPTPRPTPAKPDLDHDE